MNIKYELDKLKNEYIILWDKWNFDQLTEEEKKRKEELEIEIEDLEKVQTRDEIIDKILDFKEFKNSNKKKFRKNKFSK
jgi:hypothetical protein